MPASTVAGQSKRALTQRRSLQHQDSDNQLFNLASSNNSRDRDSPAIVFDAEEEEGEGDENELEMGKMGNGRYAHPPLYKDRPQNAFLALVKRRVVSVPLALIFLVFLLYSGKKTTDTLGLTPSTKTQRLVGGKFNPATSTCIPVPGKPDRQYALMIDAGSTGSRIHVYQFAFCQTANGKSDESPVPTLIDEGFYQLQPGLSSFKGRPKDAAESLRPLLQHALEDVPKKDHHCTPIAVKATAGLRLLGARESQAILDRIASWLDKEWPFPVVKENGVSIMDGKDEAVYAWITINYLLGLIGPEGKGQESAAVMDLGGASTQIVFEPSFSSDDVKLSPGDHVYQLNLPSGDHELYQHSHLGYGLMQARRSVNNLIAFTYIWQATPRGVALEWENLTAKDEIPHPCMTKGEKKAVELDPPGRKAVTVTFIGTGAGFDACRRVVEVVMAKDALCEVEPCAFGGVYQPKMMETFGSGPIYALSYFYDRIAPLGIGADSKPFSIATLKQLTSDVCQGDRQITTKGKVQPGWARFRDSADAMAELKGRPEYCLDLTFMYSLLNLGYELSEERELRTGKQIDDVELGWCLGAAIAMIGGSLQCTA